MTQPTPSPRSAPTPGQWRTWALWALGAQVASLFGLVAYTLWQGINEGNLNEFVWIAAFESLLAALVLWWWTAVLGRVTAGQSIPTEAAPGPIPEGLGQLRALQITFPWLTALRFSLWFLAFLSITSDPSPQASPVALTALLTVWGAAIWASNAVYGSLVRLAVPPADPALRPLARIRLQSWLNVAAALSLGMAVLNVVPIVGFSSSPSLLDQVVYGVAGGLDVLATVLALKAVQFMNTP